MFTNNFYVKFDTNHKYIVYDNNIPVYGKDLYKVMCKYYPNMNEQERTDSFIKDLDDAFRDYSRLCHINLVYDSFTHNMKEYLKTINYSYALCEIQNMSRKEIFYMFNEAPISLLYEVASNIFTYLEEQKDSHED
jgi:hypothetical protein